MTGYSAEEAPDDRFRYRDRECGNCGTAYDLAQQDYLDALCPGCYDSEMRPMSLGECRRVREGVDGDGIAISQRGTPNAAYRPGVFIPEEQVPALREWLNERDERSGGGADEASR